jgi:hypothetical protein
MRKAINVNLKVIGKPQRKRWPKSRCEDNIKVLWRVMPLRQAVRIVNSFYYNPQVVTTITYYTVTHLHSLQSLHANIPFYLFGVYGIHLETSQTALFKSKSKSHYDWRPVSQ